MESFPSLNTQEKQDNIAKPREEQKIPLPVENYGISSAGKDESAIFGVRSALEKAYNTLPVSVQKTENREERVGSSVLVDGVEMIYGRPVSEIKEKWEKEKNHFGVHGFNFFGRHQKNLAEFLEGSELVLNINTEGKVKIIDGNTRIFGAMKFGIPSENIAVSYSTPEAEFLHGTLADAVVAAKKYKTPPK